VWRGAENRSDENAGEVELADVDQGAGDLSNVYWPEHRGQVRSRRGSAFQVACLSIQVDKQAGGVSTQARSMPSIVERLDGTARPSARAFHGGECIRVKDV
jgi:hypothetical protein